MMRVLIALTLATTVSLAGAEEHAATLLGTVEAGIYRSPSGAFTIDVPVLPDLGGTIRDNDNVVTFHDSFGTQISIGAFPHDATQKWQLSTRGIRDYLTYFMANFVLPDYRTFCPGTHVESAGFSSDLMDGALFTYILLPGGSMFNDRAVFGDKDTAPVAKRGNLLFVKNGYTFVISTELSERITEGSKYDKSPAEENQLLRNRLTGILEKMDFPKVETGK